MKKPSAESILALLGAAALGGGGGGRQNAPRGSYAGSAKLIQLRNMPDNDPDRCLTQGMMPFEIDGEVIYHRTYKRARQKKNLMDALRGKE